MGMAGLTSPAVNSLRGVPLAEFVQKYSLPQLQSGFLLLSFALADTTDALSLLLWYTRNGPLRRMVLTTGGLGWSGGP
jgi:hypothetical protein